MPAFPSFSYLVNRLRAHSWQVYFTLQSVGLVPPIVTMLMAARASGKGRRFVKRALIVFGLGMLAWFVVAFILVVTGIVKPAPRP